MTWVLITGATSGIGRDAALRFAQAGLRVIATGRDLAKLAALPPTVRTVQLDVVDPDSLARAVARVDAITRGHGVDVLVSNAGRAELGPLETIPLDVVRAMFETNVVGLARVIRAFLPAMRARRGGRVIAVSSLLGRTVAPLQGAYAATKHALEAMHDVWRRELASSGVQVVSVEPGAVETPFADAALGALEARGVEPDWAPLLEGMRRLQRMSRSASIAPARVSRVLLEVATTERPSPRYVVPWVAAAQLAVAGAAPRFVWERVLRRAVGVDRRRPVARRPVHALVTGAAGPVGQAVARRLAAAGLAVTVVDRDEAGLARAVRAARRHGLRMEALEIDPSDAASRARALAHLERRAPGRDPLGLDVLVHADGRAELVPLERATDLAWRAQLEVDVLDVLALTRAFSPGMRRAGSGRVVTIGNLAGRLARPEHGVVAAGQLAREALADVWRLELGAFGVEAGALQSLVPLVHDHAEPDPALAGVARAAVRAALGRSLPARVPADGLTALAAGVLPRMPSAWSVPRG